MPPKVLYQISVKLGKKKFKGIVRTGVQNFGTNNVSAVL